MALLALGAIVAFAEWKTAFTRNYTFYAMATALIALFPLASRLPATSIPNLRPMAAMAYGTLFVALARDSPDRTDRSRRRPRLHP